MDSPVQRRSPVSPRHGARRSRTPFDNDEPQPEVERLEREYLERSWQQKQEYEAELRNVKLRLGDREESLQVELKAEKERGVEAEQRARKLEGKVNELQKENKQLETYYDAIPAEQATNTYKHGSPTLNSADLQYAAEDRDRYRKTITTLEQKISSLNSELEYYQTFHQTPPSPSQSVRPSPQGDQHLDLLLTQMAAHRTDILQMEELIIEQRQRTEDIEQEKKDQFSHFCDLIRRKGSSPASYLRTDDNLYQIGKFYGLVRDEDLPKPTNKPHKRAKKYPKNLQAQLDAASKDTGEDLSAVSAAPPDSTSTPSGDQTPTSIETAGPDPAPSPPSPAQSSSPAALCSPVSVACQTTEATITDSGCQTAPAAKEDSASQTHAASSQPTIWHIWVLPLLCFVFGILTIFFATVQISRANIEMRCWLAANDAARLNIIYLVDKLGWTTHIGRFFGRDYASLASYDTQDMFKTEF